MSVVLPKPKFKLSGILHANDSLWESLAAAIFLIIGLILSQFEGSAAFANFMYFAAVIAGSHRHVRFARTQFRQIKRINLNILMLSAIFFSCALQLWQQAAWLVVIYGAVLRLDKWPSDMVERQIVALRKRLPDKAWIVEHKNLRAVPATALDLGDTILVVPGQRMATDGVIIQGDSLIDESLLSGERIAVRKQPGDLVYAGTLNKESTLTIRATRPFQQSILFQSMNSLKDAQLFPGQLEKTLNRLSKTYLPVLLIVTLVFIATAFLWSDHALVWSERLLVFMVALTPVCLRVASSAPYRMALTGAARRGVLLKGTRQLEKLGQLDQLAFDLVGTLTSGKPELVAVDCYSKYEQQELIAIAAALLGEEKHQYGRCFRQLVSTLKDVPEIDVSNCHAIGGVGRRGLYEGEELLFGPAKLFEQLGVPLEAINHQLQEYHQQGHLCLMLGSIEQIYAMFVLEDPVKPNISTRIEELKRLGVKRLALMTEESRGTVSKITDTAVLDDCYLDLTAADKARLVVEMGSVQGSVGLVSGIDNAQDTMGLADVTIVMGGANQIAESHSADVLLLSDNLKQLNYLIRLSHLCRQLVTRNLIFASSLNLILALSALAGLVSLSFVMGCHLLSQITLITHNYRAVKEL